jgi:hypothetical protein
MVFIVGLQAEKPMASVAGNDTAEDSTMTEDAGSDSRAALGR